MRLQNSISFASRTMAGRIALVWSVLGLLVFGLSTAMFFHVRAVSGYHLLDADMAHHLRELAGLVKPALLSPDPAVCLNQDVEQPPLPFAVRDAFGAPVYRSARFPKLDEEAEHAAADAAHDNRSFITVRTSGSAPLRIGTLVVNPRPGEEAAVQVAQSEVILEDYTRSGIAWLIGVEALLLVAFVWTGTVATRRVLAPLAGVTARLRSVEAGRSDAGPRGATEIDVLQAAATQAVNAAHAARTAAAEFVTVASRELQTPLAAIRSSAEACLRADDPAAFRQLAEDLQAETERLSALIRDLRLVAVADGGNLIEARETLDLALLVTECADIAHAIGEVKHVQVKSSIGARALVSGSRTYLRRLLLDLAQFAIRCSSSPSCVEIRLDASDAEATLTVTCLGCELDPSDISRLFEPFPYINVGTPASATRVGLAVAHGIARAHDGSIRAENEAGRLALVVSLPLARA